MNENSLFAILLRSPWWGSALIAAAVIAGGRLALPEAYAQYALFAGLPFAVIAVHVAWKALRTPGAASVEKSLAVLRALSANAFSAALGEAYRGKGYSVAPCAAAGADLELARDGRVTLVACKRWKAARTGVEPLRELEAARQRREALEAVYVAIGEISDTARAYATEKQIRLVQGAELASLLPKPKP